MERAREFYEAARDSRSAGRLNACYDDARQAAELAGKAILLRTDGEFPRKHKIAARMYARGVIPPELAAKDLSRFLGDYNRGRYGFDDPVTETEAEEGLEIAWVLLDAAGQP